MTEKTRDLVLPVIEADTAVNDDGEIEIPNYALRRFAKFLLPRFQADMEKQAEQEKAG